MAEALGLDPSYLSQLENGRRKLDDWYLKKAGEFEKMKTANVFGNATPESFSLQATAEACLTYLTQFLTTCKDPAKVVWTYVELQEHFPLNKWAEAAEEGRQFKVAFRRNDEYRHRSHVPVILTATVGELSHNQGADAQLFGPPLQLVGHLKSFRRRPQGGNFLQLRFERDPAKFLFRFHILPMLQGVRHWKRLHVNNVNNFRP